MKEEKKKKDTFKEENKNLDMVKGKYARKSITQLKRARERCSTEKCYARISSAIARKRAKRTIYVNVPKRGRKKLFFRPKW